jgi:hypothetical protein
MPDMGITRWAAMLRCEECGKPAEGSMKGWRAFLGTDVDDETAPARFAPTAQRGSSARREGSRRNLFVDVQGNGRCEDRAADLRSPRAVPPEDHSNGYAKFRATGTKQTARTRRAHSSAQARAGEALIGWAYAEAGAVIHRARLRGGGRCSGYLTEKKLVANVQFPLSSIAWISSSYSVPDWRKAAGMGTSVAAAGSSTW